MSVSAVSAGRASAIRRPTNCSADAASCLVKAATQRPSASNSNSWSGIAASVAARSWRAPSSSASVPASCAVCAATRRRSVRFHSSSSAPKASSAASEPPAMRA